MKSIILSFVLIPIVVNSQITYNTEDQFSLSNPSSFSNQRIYSTGLVNFGSFENLSYLSTFLLHKQKVKSFSLGLNSEFTRFDPMLISKSELQIAYSYRIKWKYTLNSGLGLTARTDNYFSINTWNPVYFGLNAGISLVSKSWQVGISGVNVTGVSRIIDTIKFRVPSFATIFGCYDFKLDSLGKFHLIPSLYMEIGPTGFYSSLINLKFNFSNHSTGFSYSRFQPAIFYQHQLKNGINVGVSVGKYWSPLYFSFDKSWNGMLRINYVMKPKLFRISGTPSF